MENLDKALSSLAEQLGVHSEEFVFWLTNGGLASYAKMQLIQNATLALFTIIITLMCVGAIRYAMKKGEEDRYYDPIAIVLSAGIMGIVSGSCLIFSVVNFLTWWLTPEGAIVQLILNKI